jgi:hypothetical protein
MRISITWRRCRPLILMGILLLIASVMLPGAACATLYEVTFTWLSDTSPLPSTGGGEFRITFDPNASSVTTGDVQFLDLHTFTSYVTLGKFSYDPSTSNGKLAVTDAVQIMDNYFIHFSSTGWKTGNPVWDSVSLVQFPSTDTVYATSGTISAATVPLPSSLVLLGSGLIPLAWARRRRLGRK